MAPPIYSRRFWTAKNFAGTLSLVNPGPNLYIIRCVTAYTGILSIDQWELHAADGTILLQLVQSGGGPAGMVWGDIRLIWPAGETLELTSSFGWDSSGHGYELTPP